MTTAIPKKISELERQIAELEEAIEIVKYPPNVKIDQSAYPALGAIQQLLADAKTEEEGERRLAMLRANIEAQERELAALKQEQADRQAEIEKLKAQQAEEFARYEDLSQQADQALRRCVGLAQAIVDLEGELVDRPRDPVLFAKRSTATAAVQTASLQDGRIVLDTGDSSIVVMTSSGFGGFLPHVPNYRNLVQQQTKDAA